MKLLLASKSAARRQMLEAAGVSFEVVDAPLDEEAAKADLFGLSPAPLALRLAELKALSVKADDALVLGSDQTLELADGSLLSKPTSIVDARRQLHRLSGTAHKLHSAAAIARGEAIAWRSVETVSLIVRRLSVDFIESYLLEEFEHIRWSVGGYRIEGPGTQLFDRIDGSHFAILGLPLLPLLAYLRECGLLAS